MKKMFDSCLWGAIRILTAFFLALPLSWTMKLGAWTGTCLFYASRRRRNAYADLKAALGPGLSAKERWHILRRHYAHLGMTAVEMVRFPQFNQDYIQKYVQIDHPERFFELVEENRGIILLTGHFGNWELLQIISGILGKPIHALARAQKHGRLDEYLNDLRESHGSRAIRRGAGVRYLLRALRRKDLIGVVGDQDAGKLGGVILSFFGRKTTMPTGAFEFARRTGAPILPCFIARRAGVYHQIYVGEPIRCGEEEMSEGDLVLYVQKFTAMLEDFIRRFPDQWLWASKRWKHSWTKRVLILSDGKPGHVKQSEAIAERMKSLETQYGRPGMEYPTQTLRVHFKSKWHKRLFPFFSFFFIFRAQGRLDRLRFFFTPETQKQIEESSTDFVISCGASLTPLNLCLARESAAKSIVLMKPSFPFNFFRYDLAVIPAHDMGFIPNPALRMLLAPGRMNQKIFEDSAGKLHAHLTDAPRVKFGVFIGGPTRRYRMELEDVEKTLETLEKISPGQGDYLLTTSRRTPAAISRYLKRRRPALGGCQMLVIASEDPRSEVVPGIMELADTLIITEDSISMISEALHTGKPVIVLSFRKNGLPAKHRRFQEILSRLSAVVVAAPDELEDKIINNENGALRPGLAEEENKALQRKLEEIL